MTSPALAISTKYGRLYREPGTPLNSVSDVDASLAQNLLMPSITNVIDTLNKPFLSNWYAKRAAEDAVQVIKDHPGLVQKKPQEAVKWISGAARRTASAAADLGDRVHNYVELLAQGITPEEELSQQAKGYVESWNKFVADHSPEFLHLEATVFGKTLHAGKAYAGTADFIAIIGGRTYVGDYKTGRSIHAEASLQLSALRHGLTLDSADGIVDLPAIDGEIVVHLSANGYTVHETTDSEAAWETFSYLREVWDFQRAVNSAKGTWGFREFGASED